MASVRFALIPREPPLRSNVLPRFVKPGRRNTSNSSYHSKVTCMTPYLVVQRAAIVVDHADNQKTPKVLYNTLSSSRRKSLYPFSAEVVEGLVTHRRIEARLCTQLTIRLSTSPCSLRRRRRSNNRSKISGCTSPEALSDRLLKFHMTLRRCLWWRRERKVCRKQFRCN